MDIATKLGSCLGSESKTDVDVGEVIPGQLFVCELYISFLRLPGLSVCAYGWKERRGGGRGVWRGLEGEKTASEDIHDGVYMQQRHFVVPFLVG